MSPRIAFAFIALFALAACGKGPAKVDEKNAAPAALQLSAEDLHVVKNNTLASGPAITGSIQPERRADLRAEISSVVVQVLRENGDAVRRGDLLVRLDD
ncbi:MAG TPA: hypothetical protein VFV17_04870, partial [Usitatibacteraceae bacterium]|nr:hypothetical protein [Usitatibacteraceae bacterium]